MSKEPDAPNASERNGRATSPKSEQGGEVNPARHSHPASKPLQILLLALVITGVAYVLDQFTRVTSEEASEKHPSKLQRLVAHQGAFLAETALGFQAETNNRYGDAVLHFATPWTAKTMPKAA